MDDCNVVTNVDLFRHSRRGDLHTKFSLQKNLFAHPAILQEQIQQIMCNAYDTKLISGSATYCYWWYLNLVALVAERRKIQFFDYRLQCHIRNMFGGRVLFLVIQRLVEWFVLFS